MEIDEVLLLFVGIHGEPRIGCLNIGIEVVALVKISCTLRMLKREHCV